MDTPGKLKFFPEFILTLDECVAIGWNRQVCSSNLELVDRFRALDFDLTEFSILSAVVLLYPGIVHFAIWFHFFHASDHGCNGVPMYKSLSLAGQQKQIKCNRFIVHQNWQIALVLCSEVCSCSLVFIFLHAIIGAALIVFLCLVAALIQLSTADWTIELLI